ncbi:MAG TPA: hypothetical protein VNB46_03810 [Gaiellaceae bacterium]|jgi:hypothetical protein|nr:hypothetical protein [Gaiellaceae bacterium]
MRHFGIGLGSLVVGAALFVASGYVSLNSYDQVPDPAWLTALAFVSVALVVVGLLVMVGHAVRAHRSRM